VTTPGGPPVGEVHLWYALDGAIADPALLARYRALLDATERKRCDAFVFPHHRHSYLVAHALVRTVLSRYADVSPEAWRFSTNAYGRPEILAGAIDPNGRRFNLSHTDGMSVCAVATGDDVGCDAEDVARPGNPVHVADSYFSSSEVAALRALPEGARRARFFAYWTLKEAYIKARGVGLSLPLDRFSMVLDEPARPIGIAFDAGFDDDPARWSFAQLRPTPRHVVACAVRRPAATVTLRPVVPLVDAPPSAAVTRA
jgi:4'-phosphopantetheinyl transferase